MTPCLFAFVSNGFESFSFVSSSSELEKDGIEALGNSLFVTKARFGCFFANVFVTPFSSSSSLELELLKTQYYKSCNFSYFLSLVICLKQKKKKK